ncbi:MAG: trehalase-like domain-containing protein, partial [Polyangiaceae bacterium]
MASKIEDYGLIGNLQTSALVSRQGSIDWLCTPRFDSDACFAALVGYDEHGSWSIRPTVTTREIRQRYRGDTLILETEFVCDHGVIRITDALAIGTGPCDVLRVVEGIEGEVPIEMLLRVRFGYGATTPWINAGPDGIEFVAGPDALVLHSPIDVVRNDARISGMMRVKKGERFPFQLRWYP